MLTLAAAETISGVAASATAITYTITGMELNAGVESYKVLAQGQLAASAGVIYTTPGSTQAFVKSLHLVNATGADVSGIKLYKNGTGSINQITGSLTIPANGWATYEEDGWRVYNALGERLMNGVTASGGSAGDDTIRKVVYERMRYTYSNSTADADPGVGFFRLSQNLSAATQSAITLYIDDVDLDGNDRSAFLNAITPNDQTNTYRDCIVTIRNAVSTDSQGIKLKVNSITDAAGYTKLNCTILMFNPGAYVNNTNMHLTFEVSPRGHSNLAPNNGLDYIYGVPGFQTGTVHTNQAIAINITHCIPFFTPVPICIRFFCTNVNVNASCDVRFGVYRAFQTPGGSPVLGSQVVLHANSANLLGVAGPRNSTNNFEVVPAGYYWLTAQVVGSGSPSINMMGGDFWNNHNVNFNVATPNYVSSWTIANGGAIPAEGASIVAATTNFSGGSGNGLVSKLPFWLQYWNVP